MHFTAATVLAAAAFFLGGASAAAVEKRVPILATFGVSETRQCPLVNRQLIQLGYGEECGKCNNFNNGVTMQAIEQYGSAGEGKCIITLYNTPNCSDAGIVTGSGGCWQPEGGIKGWTITCPWADPNAWLPPCRK